MKTIPYTIALYFASFLALFLLPSIDSTAQSPFSFQYTGHSIGTYTPITNATVLMEGFFDDEWVNATGFTPIAFNNSVYSNAAVSADGYILFNGTPGNFQYTPLSHVTSNPYSDIVSPFGRDIQSIANGTSSVSYSFSEDLVVFQWQNVRRFGSQEIFSFQVHFHLGSGAIDFVYDVTQGPSTALAAPQIGIRGASQAMNQVSNRSVPTGTAWENSLAGTAASATCAFTSAAPASFPPSGFTFSWNSEPMGCTDPTACNFDPLAVVNNNSCEYCSCTTNCGCTDALACNFAPDATINDGSCEYCSCSENLCGCIDSLACNFNPLASIDNGLCTYDCYGCVDPSACNFSATATIDNGSCEFCSCSTACGCTDPVADNFDPNATIDNGSCYYYGEGASCSVPIPIVCGNNLVTNSTAGVLNDNTLSGANACGSSSNGGQRWYIYEPTFSSTVTFSTINSMTNFDTYLKVFSGSCGNFNCIVFNDDASGTLASSVTFEAQEGNTYYLRVGGFVNMSGSYGLTIDCGGGCTDAEACNYDVDAPFNDGSCIYGADCFGCTDTEAHNYNPIPVYDDGSCAYAIQAIVYHDYNADGIRQQNEPGLSNWPVQYNQLGATVYSNSQGELYVDNLSMGSYTLQLINETDNWISSTPEEVVVVLPTSNIMQFGLVPSTGEAFFITEPYQGFWDIIHCDDGYEAGIFLNNTGSVPISGQLTVTCSENFTPVADFYGTIAPDVSQPGFAQWNITNFEAGQSGLLSFHIEGPGPVNIGQTFNFDFVLTLYAADGTLLTEQTYQTSPFVACAYDPNDKTAQPAGYEEPHFILAGERLQYRIRFQNTGNLPAEDVLITDQIDTEVLDLSTFQPLYASASMSTCLHDDGFLEFIFEDIYLPDSVHNPEGSHGFVVFAISTYPTIPAGSVIENTANIYFDQNPAIVTNTYHHTIFDCSSFQLPISNTSLCEGMPLELNANQPYAESYEWHVNNDLESISPSWIMAGMEAGIHQLNLMVANPLCSANTTVSIEVMEAPGDVVTINENGMLEAPDGNAWAWFYNGQPLGETAQSINPVGNGTYTVETIGANGCSQTSEEFMFVNVAETSMSQAIVYPNPMLQQAILQLAQGKHYVRVFDQTGKQIMDLGYRTGNVELSKQSLSAGLYTIQLMGETKTQTLQLIVQ